MKWKIISILVIFLIIIGSIGATGFDNLKIKKEVDLSEQYTEITKDIESDCGTCEYDEYHFGLLGDPFVLIKSDKLVELSGEPPKSWDWRNATYNGTTGNWVTSVKDQGKCGSCGSFATTACFESAYKIYKGDPNIDVDFSEQFMVSCGTEWIGIRNSLVRMKGCQGATILAVLEFIKEYGAINESCFPYTSGINGAVPPCSDKCEKWNEQRIRATDYNLVMGEFIEEGDDIVYLDPTNFKNALVQYGPLATPMFVYEDFPEYSGGIYELNRSKSLRRLGGHMVLIVGYKDDPSIDTGGYWICKNSWGTDWGENGYFRIKYDDFNTWLNNEVTNRIQNIKNFRDLIEFFIWTYFVITNAPTVGIGYTFSAFFTGVTIKKLITTTPQEEPIEDFVSPRIFDQRKFFFPIIKSIGNIKNIIKTLIYI